MNVDLYALNILGEMEDKVKDSVVDEENFSWYNSSIKYREDSHFQRQDHAYANQHLSLIVVCRIVC